MKAAVFFFFTCALAIGKCECIVLYRDYRLSVHPSVRSSVGRFVYIDGLIQFSMDVLQ